MADEAGLKTSSHSTDELSAHLLVAPHPRVLEKHAFARDRVPGRTAQVVNGRSDPGRNRTGMRFDERALEPYRLT